MLNTEGNLKRIFAVPYLACNLLMDKVRGYEMREVAPPHDSAAVHVARGVYKIRGEIPAFMVTSPLLLEFCA
jgi:thiamine pyrophosphate-dependent acetolactate synthase large subunit-like protein